MEKKKKKRERRIHHSRVHDAFSRTPLSLVDLHEMSKAATTKRKREALTSAVLDAVTCPITMALVVKPVVAEDGATYESEAITRALAKRPRVSPRSNSPMGAKLVSSRDARNLVEAAIESGCVDAKDASAWHVASARAKAAGELPGGLSGAKAHLAAAKALAPTPEGETLARAALLREKAEALVREADASGVAGVAKFLGFGGEGAAVAPAKAPRAPMAAYDPALEGAIVYVLDDAAELERLCMRPAPGAEECSDFCAEMAEMCGNIFVIENCCPSLKTYDLAPVGNACGEWNVPFDACSIVWAKE